MKQKSQGFSQASSAFASSVLHPSNGHVINNQYYIWHYSSIKWLRDILDAKLPNQDFNQLPQAGNVIQNFAADPLPTSSTRFMLSNAMTKEIYDNAMNRYVDLNPEQRSAYILYYVNAIAEAKTVLQYKDWWYSNRKISQGSSLSLDDAKMQRKIDDKARTAKDFLNACSIILDDIEASPPRIAAAIPATGIGAMAGLLSTAAGAALHLPATSPFMAVSATSPLLPLLIPTSIGIACAYVSYVMIRKWFEHGTLSLGQEFVNLTNLSDNQDQTTALATESYKYVKNNFASLGLEFSHAARLKENADLAVGVNL